MDYYPNIDIIISKNGPTNKIFCDVETALLQNVKHLNSTKFIKQSYNEGPFSTFGIFEIISNRNFFFGLTHTISNLNETWLKVLNNFGLPTRSK